MIPRLYRADNAYGTARTLIGNIANCSRCICKEVLNGEYLLELTTDVSDFTANTLSAQKIIEAKANPFDPPQLFIIYKTERLINGKINAYAEHIKSLCNQYVTTGTVYYTEDNEITLKSVTPSEAWYSIVYKNTEQADRPPFLFNSNITTKSDYYLGLTKSETYGNILGGAEGSFLDTWRGEYHYNNFVIEFNKNRGRSQNFELRYGRNISDATQTEDISNIYTHILPYGSVQNLSTGNTVNLVGNVTPIENSESSFRKIFLYDCSNKSQNLKIYSHYTDSHSAGEGYAEAREKMSSYARSYAKSNKLGSTLISINVTHRSELDEMTSIGLGDTVKILLDNFGTTTTAKITETEFDVLNERWNSLNVGEQKVTLADLLLNRSKYLNGKL